MVAGGVDVEDEIYVGGDGAGVVEEVVVLVGVCRLNDLAVHPDAMTRWPSPNILMLSLR